MTALHEHAEVRSTWRSRRPVDVRTSLSILGRGPRDCVVRDDGGSVWWCTRAPDGPVTILLRQGDDRTVEATAWGVGAPWLLDVLPTLFGSDEDLEPFVARHDGIREASRRYAGLRVLRTQRVVEAMIFAVLEQRVVGMDAVAARQRLLARFGERAPGPAPAGMRVPPSAQEWRLIPSWEWHRANVDPQRARAALLAARHATRLEETAGMPMPDAYARLSAVPGIGPWTAAETGKVALGDTDAVSIGDYHLGRWVTWALTGRDGGTDDDMLELLEPYRPYRQVAIRLIELAVPAPPRRGARMPRVDYRDR